MSIRPHKVVVALNASERLLFRAVAKRRGFRSMSEMIRYLVRAYDEDTRRDTQILGRGMLTGASRKEQT